MKLELTYTSTGQDENKNEDFVITRKEQFLIQSESLANLSYNPYTKTLVFEFESGKTMYVGIQAINKLLIQ